MNNDIFRAYYGFYYEGLEYKTKNNIPILDKTNTNYQILIDNLYNISFCTFRNVILFNGNPISDFDLLGIKSKLSSIYHANPITKEVKEAVSLVAAQHKINTLKEAFEAIICDGKSYIPRLIHILGAKDTPINHIILRKWLISAIARVYDPGCYTEGTLILYGEQAAGKSSFFKYINLSEEYYCSSPVDISNSMKISQTLSGKHIIEFAELSSIKKSELETVKQFLTTETDTYTPKFANFPISVPRSMIFGGSTNNMEILFDNTGNRRFWCVEVGNINVAELKLIRHQLWAEMIQAYKTGELSVLTADERKLLEDSNRTFAETDPLMDYMHNELDKHSTKTFRAYELLDIARRYDSKSTKYQVSRIMSQLGWTKTLDYKGTFYTNPNFRDQLITFDELKGDYNAAN